MRAFTIIKAGIGTGAAILLLAAAPAAQASSGATVPCSGPGGGAAGLIAAINAANASGGSVINLAAGCTYALTAAYNTNPMLGDNGLPVITSRIILNGFRTTIAGNDTSFRILMVTGAGNLTLQGLTITGGHTGGLGGGIFNLEGTLTLESEQGHRQRRQGGMMSAGGGIASGTLGTGPLGTTTLNSSQVDGNTTSGSGGGILNHGGTLTLNASQVNGNTAATAEAASPAAPAGWAATGPAASPSTQPGQRQHLEWRPSGGRWRHRQRRHGDHQHQPGEWQHRSRRLRRRHPQPRCYDHQPEPGGQQRHSP